MRTVYYIVIKVFSYKKKLTPYLFLRTLVDFYTLFSTIFIVFMICLILINFKGVKKKIRKRKKSERRNSIQIFYIHK